MKRFLMCLAILSIGAMPFSCKPEEKPKDEKQDDKQDDKPTPKPIAVTGLTLSPESMDLGIGETQKVTPTVAPSNATDQSVTWTSSNTDVASVSSEGVVSGLKKGTSEIKATTVDGGYTATCTVTVFERKDYRLRVSINGGAFSEASDSYSYTLLPPGQYSGIQRFLFHICEGDSEKPVQDPDPAHYSESIVSQNPEGAVDILIAGQEAYGGSPKYHTPWVYPQKAGTATVLIQYNDGEGNILSREIRFEIKSTPVTSIGMGCKEFVLGAGNTRQMKAMIEPADASFQRVVWSSTNPAVARVNQNGLVTAVAKGEAQIKAVNEEGVEGVARIIVWPQPNAVDLGLSVLWADCNLGAESATSTVIPPYCYFAWSETVPEKLDGKRTTNKNDLTYWDDDKKYTKYCMLSQDGAVDNKTRLDAKDDAASVILGNGWRMPTAKEVQDLWNMNNKGFSQRYTQYTSPNQRIYIIRFTSSNGKYIDIPMWAAYGTNIANVGQLGFYWTSDLAGGTGAKADEAQYLYMVNQGTGSGDMYVYWKSTERYNGYCIRPVKDK